MTYQKLTLLFYCIILQHFIYKMFYYSILYIKIIFTTHQNNILISPTIIIIKHNNKVKKDEREMNKKLYFYFSILVYSKIERYCSYVVKIIRFETSHKRFFVFGVLNVLNIWHLAHLLDVFSTLKIIQPNHISLGCAMQYYQWIIYNKRDNCSKLICCLTWNYFIYS